MAMDVTKPYKFIRFGAMDVTKPYKFIRFVAMDVIKPYQFKAGPDPGNPQHLPDKGGPGPPRNPRTVLGQHSISKSGWGTGWAP